MKNIFIVTFMALASICNAQYFLDYISDHPRANFYEIEAAVDHYYQTKDKGRGSGYKQYKRWAMNTEPYVYPSGEMFNYQTEIYQTYRSYKKKHKSTQRSFHGYWTEEGPTDYNLGNGWNGGNGRVNCITFHPNTEQSIFVGTPGGGLWHSSNGGNGWTPLTDGLPTLGVSGFVIDHDDSDIMYMLTGDGDGNNMPTIGVIKSYDAGITWTQTGLNWVVNWDYPTTTRAFKLLIHPHNSQILFIASSNGIWRTQNGGNTWAQEWSLNTWDIEFHPDDPEIMYAAGGNFFRSDDGGLTWAIDGDSDFPTAYNRIAVGVSAASPDNVYLLFGGNVNGNGTFSGFYISTDTGHEFDLQSNTPNILGYLANGNDDDHQASYDLALAVDPNDGDIIYTGGINVYKSVNGGVDWDIISHWYEDGNTIGYTHADIHSLEIWGETIYCGSDGGIFSSSDGGSNWNNLSNGLGIMQFYDIEIASNIFSGGTQDNGCNQWNSGASAATHSIGADGFKCLIDYSNTNIRYQSDQDNKFRSTNGGVSFSNINVPGVSGYWNAAWIMDQQIPSRLFVAQNDVWRTSTGGVGLNAWVDLNAGFTNNNRIGALGQGTLQPNMLYASDFVSLRRTNNALDASPTWVDVTAGLPAHLAMISDIAVDPLDSSRVWVTFQGISNGNKVFFSPNAGQNWFNESGTLPNVPINCIEMGGLFGELYIGTDIGVFYRDNDLSDWVFFNNGLPATRVLDLDIDEEKVYAGTFGRGIWSSDHYSECPIQLVLTPQNNPSNPQSTGRQVYHASNSITSSRLITGGLGTNVQYHGDIQTILTEGFWVQTNSMLTVDTNGCPE